MKSNINLIALRYNPFSGKKNIQKIITLNDSQKELWLSCIIGKTPANLAYNESVSLKLSGNFNLEVFEKAVNYLTRCHESLRGNISQNGENLIIYEEIKTNIIYEDFSKIDPTLVDHKLKSFIETKISIPFDLYHDVLFKIFVHKINENTTYLTLIIHHIICDGWSIGLLLEDLSSSYNSYLKGDIPNLELSQQISTYAKEIAIYKRTEAYKPAQDFWIEQYKDEVPVLNLPIDFSRPSIRTYAGLRNDYLLGETLYSSIKALAAKANCSVVTTLIAAFEIFLYNQTGQEDIFLGLPAAGQMATEQFRVVGHCVNLLPLRSKILPLISFIAFLEKRRNEMYDVYDNQKITFSELLKKLKVKRDQSTVPLIPVVFNFDKGMDDKVKFDGLEHQIFSNPKVCQTFEISLNVNGSKDTVIFEWAYNTQLFKSETIERMNFEFENLLKKVTSDPNVLIKDAFPENNPFPQITPNFVDYPQNVRW